MCSSDLVLGVVGALGVVGVLGVLSVVGALGVLGLGLGALCVFGAKVVS